MSQADLVTIEGQLRSDYGKNAARKLRAQGLIPANIIGKAQSKSITINPKWLSKAWNNGKKFKLTMEGSEQVVRIHELQIHAVKRRPLHVDLMVE